MLDLDLPSRFDLLDSRAGQRLQQQVYKTLTIFRCERSANSVTSSDMESPFIDAETLRGPAYANRHRNRSRFRNTRTNYLEATPPLLGAGTGRPMVFKVAIVASSASLPFFCASSTVSPSEMQSEKSG